MHNAPQILSRQNVGYGSVVDGFARFQALDLQLPRKRPKKKKPAGPKFWNHSGNRRTLKIEMFCAHPLPSGRAQGDGAKVTERAQNADFRSKAADFRRFSPSPGNSSIWRAQKTLIFAKKPEMSAENRRKKLKIGLRHLRSVTFSAALFRNSGTPRKYPENTQNEHFWYLR